MPDKSDNTETLTNQRKVLADVGDFALQSEDFDEMLHEAYRLAGETLGTSRAKVMEIKPEGECLLVRAGRDLRREISLRPPRGKPSRLGR